MLFCSKCGAIMMPKKEKDKKVMVCTSCGFVDKKSETTPITEKVDDKIDIPVVDAGEDDKNLPEIEAECPKCKNQKAWYWLIQTRSGDEAETKFYKCMKCKHIWREYD